MKKAYLWRVSNKAFKIKKNSFFVFCLALFLAAIQINVFAENIQPVPRSALIRRIALKDRIPVNIILENAESDDINNSWRVKTVANQLSKAQQPKTGKYALQWQQPVNSADNNTSEPSLIFDLEKAKKNLSKHKQLTFYLKNEDKKDFVQSKIALKEESGEVWIQKAAPLVSSTYQLFGTNLTKENFELIKGSPVFNKKLDLADINEIQFYFSSNTKLKMQTFYLDDFILYGKEIHAFPKVSNIKPMVSTKSIVAKNTVSSPNISDLKINDKEIVKDDFIQNKPLISAQISDPDFGVATWNIEIINIQNNTIVETEQGYGSLVSQNAIVISYQVETPLNDGTYTLTIKAYDGQGNLATLSSPEVKVDSSLKITDILNGPNPFNPMNEITNIQYQLSCNADIKIIIYSISGEKLWTKSFISGQYPGGAVGFNSIEWNGVNSFGEVVANGPYIVYIIAKAEGETKVGKCKILVLK